MPILTLQKRMMELGRIRLGGEKGEKQIGKKLEAFRFTSASKTLMEAVAAMYGGKVEPWVGATDEGYWQVYTEASEVRGIFPPIFADIDGTPTVPLTQFFEEWLGGSVRRRCDGVNESISGSPCLCAAATAAAAAEGQTVDRVCKPTTRMSFMLPDLPGLGVWRVESKGYNAAVELPGTAQVLQTAAAQGKFIPMVLRLENRTVKKADEKYPRRFVVPVLELPDVTVNQLAAGDVPLAINAPVGLPSKERPGLPPAPDPPDDALAAGEPAVELGAPPPLPGEDAQWASESDVTGVLEIAASIDEATHDKAVNGIAKHRETHGGMVDAKWLGKQADALLAKAAKVPA